MRSSLPPQPRRSPRAALTALPGSRRHRLSEAPTGESSETEVSEPQNSNIESTVSDDKDKDKEVNNKTEQQEETSYLWLYIVIGAVVVLAGARNGGIFPCNKKETRITDTFAGRLPASRSRLTAENVKHKG